VGPLEVLLRWGARVAGVDLPSPPVWQRVLRAARQGAGELLVPVNREAPAALHPDSGDEAIARWAGLNLVRQVPERVSERLCQGVIEISVSAGHSG
jgi:hypothetical protein